MVQVSQQGQDSNRTSYVLYGVPYDTWNDYYQARLDAFTELHGDPFGYLKKSFVQDLLTSSEKVSEKLSPIKNNSILKNLSSFELSQNHLSIGIKSRFGTNRYNFNGQKFSYQPDKNQDRPLDKKSAEQMVKLAMEAGINPMKFSGTPEEIKLLKTAEKKAKVPAKTMLQKTAASLGVAPKKMGSFLKTPSIISNRRIIGYALLGSGLVLANNYMDHVVDEKATEDKENKIETAKIDKKDAPKLVKNVDAKKTKKTPTRKLSSKKKVAPSTKTVSKVVQKNEQVVSQENKVEDVAVQNIKVDSILRALELEKAGYETDLASYQEEFDKVEAMATPLWDIENLLSFVKNNRWQGGNLRINTHGPMFTPRNILNHNKIAGLGDEKRMAEALAIGAGYDAFAGKGLGTEKEKNKDFKLRKEIKKYIPKFLKTENELDKIDQDRRDNLDKRLDKVNRSVAKKNRRGRQASRIDQSSRSTNNQKYNNTFLRRDQYTNLEAHRPLYTKMFHRAVDKLEDVFEPQLFGYYDKNDNFQPGLYQAIEATEENIKSVEKDIQARKKELRAMGYKVGTVQEAKDDIFDDGVKTELADNTIHSNYQDNKEIVTGYEGVGMDKTFYLGKIYKSNAPKAS